MKFNPEVPAEGQNYLGYSRGREADDSLGILFKGAANAIEGAGKVVDDHIQGNIRQDITKEYDAANDTFGIDAQAKVGGESTGTGMGALPGEVQEAQRWMGRLSGAFQSGSMAESHYWGRLEQRVKSLRQKYPGYREQIDKMTAEVTGGTPANILRQNMFQEIDRVNREDAANASEQDKFIDMYAEFIDPIELQKWNEGDRSPERFDAIRASAHQKQYEVATNNQLITQMTIDDKQGELNQDAVDQNLRTQANQLLNGAEGSVFKGTGMEYKQLQAKIKEFGADKSISPEERAELMLITGQLRASMRAGVEQLISQQWDTDGRNYGKLASKPAIDDVLAMVDRRVNMLEAQMNDKDFGLFAINAATLEARKNTKTAEFLDKYRALEMLGIIKENGGGDVATSMFLESEAGLAVKDSIAAAIVAATLSDTPDGPESSTEIIQDLKGTGVKDPDVYKKVIETPAKVLTNPKASDYERINSFNKMYGEKNSDFLLEILERDQARAFADLTTPEITRGVAELEKNHPGTLGQYKNFVDTSFEIVFKPKSDLIHQTFRQVRESGGDLDIVIDPETGQLELRSVSIADDPEQVDPLTGETIATGDPAQKLQDMEVLTVQTANNLKELNVFLKNYKPLIEAQDKDFVVEMRSLFQAIDLEVEGEEEGQDQSEPLAATDTDDDEELGIAGLDQIPDIDLDSADQENVLFGGGEEEALAGSSGNDEIASATQVIQSFEGFETRPYWDVNALRIGYGSDTVTRADGTIERVTKGTRVTKADADRDLARRTAEFQQVARKQAGPAWDQLPVNVKAALSSVTYNYGRLPNNVVRAVQTGDKKAIAQAILKLRGHNGGINAKRRTKEARIVLSG